MYFGRDAAARVVNHDLAIVTLSKKKKKKNPLIQFFLKVFIGCRLGIA